MKRIIATAVVDVKLRVKCDSVWGGDCLISQIHNQAGREANDVIADLLHKNKNIQRVCSSVANINLEVIDDD